MTQNVGKTDKIIRILLGALLVVAAYLWSWYLLAFAALAFVTAFTGLCGIYRLFGINTCKIKTKK